MTIEIKVPTLPESVSDATVAKWYKKVGDQVNRDENLIDLETDKVMLEVPAPASGVLQEVKVEEGAVVTADQLLAILVPGEVTQPTTDGADASTADSVDAPATADKDSSAAGPAARRAALESGVDVSSVAGTGKGGRVTKSDVNTQSSGATSSAATIVAGSRTEKRVPMSRLRARIAERLVEVQQTAALLTTFNEINMKPVRDLRARYKDQFEKKHGVRLGFMSFFTQAVVHALQQFPAVNASIDGTDIIYHNFFDIGIAIGSPRGLVVPILRNAENMNMAEIEGSIKDYAHKAKEGKLSIDDMTGGTFTITNGGVYGSMMSTPIINPPQTAILGMHNIVDRAVVENGEIVVRPMMYVALSYDHRVIDGKESVSFLKTIKELIEDPARLILGV
jgi:2-oxoglutarate dehydrogenase E2 component (dihydrolipoamide succinyltransferase)